MSLQGHCHHWDEMVTGRGSQWLEKVIIIFVKGQRRIWRITQPQFTGKLCNESQWKTFPDIWRIWGAREQPAWTYQGHTVPGNHIARMGCPDWCGNFHPWGYLTLFEQTPKQPKSNWIWAVNTLQAGAWTRWLQAFPSYLNCSMFLCFHMTVSWTSISYTEKCIPFVGYGNRLQTKMGKQTSMIYLYYVLLFTSVVFKIFRYADL